MQFLEYLETDGGCYFDTSILPSIDTEIQLLNFIPYAQLESYAVFIGSALNEWDDYGISLRDEGGSFGIRFGDCYNGWGYSFNQGDEYDVLLDQYNFNYGNSTNSIYVSTFNTGNTNSFYIGAEHNSFYGPDTAFRASVARFGEIIISQNGTVVGDFVPAEDNGDVGFYDKISEVFCANLGNGTPTAGPVIGPTPSSSSMILGGEGVLNAYVGYDNVLKIYLGSTLIFEGEGGGGSLPSGYTQIADGIRSSNAPYWNGQEYIDTGIYVSGEPEVRIKYIGSGVFSDRLIGFDSSECSSDDEDFRWFPEYLDAGNVRIEGISTDYYADGVEQDITFGNIWATDNKTNSSIASDTPGGYIDTNATIKIDMSTSWIKEVKIKMDGTIVWNGVAAYDETNQEYGMFDLVSQTFVSASCTVVPNV